IAGVHNEARKESTALPKASGQGGELTTDPATLRLVVIILGSIVLFSCGLLCIFSCFLLFNPPVVITTSSSKRFKRGITPDCNVNVAAAINSYHTDDTRTLASGRGSLVTGQTVGCQKSDFKSA